MADDCWICRIVHDSRMAHVVHEDARLIAFLDRGPIRAWHTQVVTKQHFPYFDEAPAEVVPSIVLLGQKLAVAMKRLYRVPRVAFLFTGGDIAHVHAHVLPMLEKTAHVIATAVDDPTRTPRRPDRSRGAGHEAEDSCPAL
jgi:histidine triad (HIT) family protein